MGWPVTLRLTNCKPPPNIFVTVAVTLNTASFCSLSKVTELEARLLGAEAGSLCCQRLSFPAPRSSFPTNTSNSTWVADNDTTLALQRHKRHLKQVCGDADLHPTLLLEAFSPRWPIPNHAWRCLRRAFCINVCTLIHVLPVLSASVVPPPLMQVSIFTRRHGLTRRGPAALEECGTYFRWHF